MKYLCVHFTPKALIVSHVDAGATVKFLDGFTLPLSDGCWTASTRRFSDAGEGISSMIRNELTARGIATKKAIVVTYNSDFKSEELTLGKTPKRYLEQLITQTLIRTNKVQGETIIDYRESGATPDDECVYDVTTCPAYVVSDLYGIMKSSGLQAAWLVSETAAMELLCRNVAAMHPEPFSLVFFTDTYIHQICWDGNAFSNVRTHQTASNDMFSDYQDTMNASTQQDPVFNHINVFVRYYMGALYNSMGNTFPLFVCGNPTSHKKTVEQLKKVYACRLVPTESMFKCQKQSNELSMHAVGLHAAATAVSKEPIMPCNLFSKYELSRGGVANSFSPNPLAIIMGIFAICVCACSFFVKTQNNAMQKEIEYYADFIESPEVLAVIERNSKLNVLTNMYERIDQTCALYIDSLTSSDRFRSAVITEVESLLPEGVRITSYSFDRNTLALSCLADNQDLPSDFTEQLVQSGNYVGISYGGFQKTATLSAGTMYSFDIAITLW